jgi:methylphosphotriester-DNA--protein-cysteine methyltransferase
VAQALIANQAHNPSLHVALRQRRRQCADHRARVSQRGGHDFATWRRQARLMKAVELLAGGSSVKQVAFATGYRQPSAFVEMFRPDLFRLKPRPKPGRAALGGIFCHGGGRSPPGTLY